MASPDQSVRDPASSLGTEHQPLASPMLDDPRPFYARARREQPVFWSDSLGMWVVTRYDDVQAVARDAVRFSSIDAFTPVQVAPPPPLLEVLVPGQTLEYFPSATARRLEAVELEWDPPSSR
jgi:cytochrome P450